MLCLFIFLFSLPVVSAEDATETTETSVNEWIYKMWDSYLSDIDLSAYDISVLNDYVSKNNMIIIDPSADNVLKSLRMFAFDGNFVDYDFDTYYASGTPFIFDKSAYNYSSWSNNILNFLDNELLEESNDTYKLNLIVNFVFSSSADDVFLIPDYDIYHDMILTHPDSVNQIFYCSNPFQSLLDYFNSLIYDDMFFDVAKTKYNNFIYFYDCFDSYKGKYNYDMYTSVLDNVYSTDDFMLNYLNSSVSFKDELYYTSNMSSNFNDNESMQHSEELTFYLKLNSETTDYLNSFYHRNIDSSTYDCIYKSDTMNNYITNYLIENTYTVHYENCEISFDTWYSDYVVKWLNTKEKIDYSLYSIEYSNGDVGCDWYVKFRMPNTYSFIYSNDSGNYMMSGCRTASSAKLFDPTTGKEDTSSGGLGSNIDLSDLGNLKDKSELLDNGWENGYPNQSGSYPYRITIYDSGTLLMMIYFKSKPDVSSYAYTDTQIKYSVNIADIPGYAYIPEYNISYQFDIASLNKKLSSANSSIEIISNALSSGLDVISIATGSLTADMVSLVVDLVSFISSINNNIDEFLIDYNLYLWTNYVGTKDSYKGYRCIFNWDIGVDEAFVRDNSDDTHDYSEDYVPDLAPGTEVPTGSDSGGNTYIYNYYYYDNNGNIHGGGDITYVPTEPVTSSLGYDYDNYDFGSQLVSNSNSFFDFIRSALSFMPAWVYLSIAASIAVLIALRILGR